MCSDGFRWRYVLTPAFLFERETFHCRVPHQIVLITNVALRYQLYEIRINTVVRNCGLHRYWIQHNPAVTLDRVNRVQRRRAQG